MKLQDKVALITGAGAGMGRAGAILFAKEGARIVVVDVNDRGGEETVRLIKEACGEASYIHADVSVVAEVKRMIQSAVETYGKLNIFWSNAGNAGPGHIDRVTEDAFDLTLAIHIKGGFFGAKFAIPEIIKSGGGSILFTTSVSAHRPSNSAPTYSIAKTSLTMLARSLAIQNAKKGIRVNCIAPGPIDTGLWPTFIGRDPDLTAPEVLHKLALEQVPMGRLGKPEEIAQAALYLVSDDASYVTGTTLHVDGGQTAR